ncbi:hypothetical protein CTheo_781 [Ceratobasidium theobromae]|uniref:Chromo domain-containing protein n=1 Tax=Ceratobasidium theobromae TaxID=1582974 RepID=A0A5N5QVQ9_9AGAM|nr:hypothetical protein CTheo_781 [Ceratobasidium theobromae]
MPRSSDGSEGSGSDTDNEYEVEYIYAAKWDGSGWEYEVHWYGYDTDCDTWEPEVHLTHYGSADLVNRFWKEFPKKRYSNPPTGTKFEAKAEWLIEERKYFLARRPKGKPVKGVTRPPKKTSDKILLVGDSESESEDIRKVEDDDILRSSSEENAGRNDDEDILRSSSSDDTPLAARRSSAQPSSSAGPGTKARTTMVKRRHTIQTAKPSWTGPSSSTKPSTIMLSKNYAPVAGKAPKIGRDPPPPPRRGRTFPRQDMQAGSISKDFVGIGTKGKQAVRAGEVLVLGRTLPGPIIVPPPPARNPNPFSGLSMRKPPQPANNVARSSGTPVDSPVHASPREVVSNVPPSLSQTIQAGIDEVAAGLSPPNSLFDGSYADSDEEPHLFDPSEMDVVDDVPEFMNDPVPPPPPPVVPPQPMRGGARPTQPAAPTTPTPIHNSVDELPSSREVLSPSLPFGLSPLLPTRPLDPLLRPTVPPLQEGEWSWTGDLYLTTSEPIPDDETTTKEVRSRACEIVIRGLVLSDDTPTKVFKSTFKNYIQGKITISGAMDLNLSHAIIASGALEPTQAAWMTCKDQEDSPEWELWDGLVHKMEQFCWVSDIKIYTTGNIEFARRLLLIPTALIRKYRHAPQNALRQIVDHFNSPKYINIPSFVVLMVRNATGPDEPEAPPPMQLAQIPQYWQEIPPDMKSHFEGVNCLVFPSEEFDSDFEVRLLRHQLHRCGAQVLEGRDPAGQAAAIFVHRRYVDSLSQLKGFSRRKQVHHKRFYAYGSGGNWRVAEWDLREVWKWGGMVTFTPAAMIEDPWVVKKVVAALEDKPFWETYIEPKTVGILGLRARKEDNQELAWALDTLMIELITSTEFAYYNLALTAPPKWGGWEEEEWARVQLERALIQDEEELRKSCEDEVVEAFKQAIESQKEEEEASKGNKAKEQQNGEQDGGWNMTTDGGVWGEGAADSGNDGTWGTTAGWGSGGGGGFGDSGWGSGAAATTNSTTDTFNFASGPAADASDTPDVSGIGSADHIRETSDEVISGLEWFQIQPCFMRDIRRFIVIDSSARVKNIREDKLEDKYEASGQLSLGSRELTRP